MLSVSLLGYALEVAQGVAPKACIATYKVCWTSRCLDLDILGAFDQGVIDGINITSALVGGGVVLYYMDSTAIGSFT